MPHQQIASDEYWGNERTSLPAVALKDGLIDGVSGVHVFASYGAAKAMRLYSTAKKSSHASEQIQSGQELPLLTRGEGLVRVVEDVREYPYSESLLSKLLKKDLLDPDSFDGIAERMRQEKLYKGRTAWLRTAHETSEHEARIWRIVSYLTGSKSGAMLEGITSSELNMQPNQIPWTYLLPPLVVGEVYKRNRAATRISKVIAADIIIPGSTVREKSTKKSKFSYTPRAALNF